MKKIIIWFISLISSFSLCSAVYAADNTELFKADVLNAMESFEPEINIEKYNFSVDEMCSAMSEIFDYNTNSYNLSTTYTVTMMTTTALLTGLACIITVLPKKLRKEKNSYLILLMK